MQFTQLAGLLAAFLPLSVMASPVANENTLVARGNDICTRTASIGDPCNHGPEESEPHICGPNDSRSVLHCVSDKGRTAEAVTATITAAWVPQTPNELDDAFDTLVAQLVGIADRVALFGAAQGDLIHKASSEVAGD
ncbi:hypothetical protein F5Y19DRAFT_477988 [Xylariaceae sp. FL1651]|nr:hypothetical protein F5Y19DRAFT_477988 [Xylariaceae sp. FL1651]